MGQSQRRPVGLRCQQVLVHAEHIPPQTPAPNVLEALDKLDEYDDFFGRLDNLTQLEKTTNSSVSNGSYASKMSGYKQSAFMLTKSLAEKTHVGVGTKLNRSVASLIQFESWHSHTTSWCQEMLTVLARRVRKIQKDKKEAKA